MAVEEPSARQRVPAGACCGAIEWAISGTISAVLGAAIVARCGRVIRDQNR